MADATGTDADTSSPPPPPRPFVAVLRNPNLRRLQLAFAGSAIGDWAYATAVAVWAYGEGGARSVGIWMAIRYTLRRDHVPVPGRPSPTSSRRSA